MDRDKRPKERDLLLGYTFETDVPGIHELMQSGSAALGAPMCFHYYWAETLQHDIQLQEKWIRHLNPRCMRHQKKYISACTDFCGPHGVVEMRVADQSGGYLHTCPFGCIKIAASVTTMGIRVGTLFAGPFSNRKNARLKPKQKVCLVSALALRLGQLVHADEPPHNERRKDVLNFVTARCKGRVNVSDLAEVLGLSPSRTAHTVKTLFGCSFSALLLTTRLNAAARSLLDTDTSCADIAQMFGFYDQSHFTRLFKAHYQLPPLKYRAQNRREVPV